MTKPNGSWKAKVMFVGEAPGQEEDKQGSPFVGQSGLLLGQMAAAAGVIPEAPAGDLSPRQMEEFWQNQPVLLSNVARVRPPSNKIEKFFYNKTQAKKEGIPEFLGAYPNQAVRDGTDALYAEIDRLQPNVIVPVGNTALWALTGHSGITSWRGSYLRSFKINGRQYKVIPTIHPAMVLRRMDWKQLVVHDLRKRVVPASVDAQFYEPTVNYISKPSWEEARDTLDWLLGRLESGEQLRLSSDIETRNGQIACEGLAWSSRDAICIPIMLKESPYHYWDTIEQEAELVWKIKKIHEHPNALIVGQNFNYDRQYFLKLWGFWSNLYMDTMTAHHTAFPSMKKSLEFLSSLYCEHHVYWKDESGEWDPKLGEEQLWIYNCKDVCVTYEVSEALEGVLDKRNVRENYNFQLRMRDHVLRAWLRGINYDTNKRRQAAMDLMQQIQQYQALFVDLLGVSKLNPNSKAYWFDSPDQLKKFFYEIMGVKKVIDRKTGNPSTGKEALPTIGKREPLLRDFCQWLAEYRSLRVYYDTFISAKIDDDGRWRMEQDVDGTETFRFASRKDAFGKGANTQNLPKGTEEEGEE